jgi:hypothetical protein
MIKACCIDSIRVSPLSAHSGPHQQKNGRQSSCFVRTNRHWPSDWLVGMKVKPNRHQATLERPSHNAMDNVSKCSCGDLRRAVLLYRTSSGTTSTPIFDETLDHGLGDPKAAMLYSRGEASRMHKSHHQHEMLLA